MTIVRIIDGGDQLSLNFFPNSEELSPIIPSLLNQKEKAFEDFRTGILNAKEYTLLSRPSKQEIELKKIERSIEFLKQILGKKYESYVPD